MKRHATGRLLNASNRLLSEAETRDQVRDDLPSLHPKEACLVNYYVAH